MFSEAILHTHLFVKKSEIKDLRTVYKDLTVRNIFDPDISVPMYKETKGALGFPIHYFSNTYGVPLPKVAKKFIDLRTKGTPVNYNFTGNLWDAQKKVFDRFCQYYKAGYTGFLHTAPPGSGKTVWVLSVLQYLKRTALIIVNKTDLVEQWVSRILEYTDIKRSQIGIAANAKVDDPKGKVICIGLVHTCALSRFHTKEFLNSWGVLVADEVDRSLPPQTFAPVISLFPARIRIGVSATMKRQDGMHVFFDNHFGQCRINSSGSNRMPPKVIVVKYSQSSGSIYAKSAKNRRGELLSKIAKNSGRNMMIAAYVSSIYKANRRCIVVSDRTIQLDILRGLLHRMYKIPYEEMGFYARSVQLLNGKTLKFSDAMLRKTKNNVRILLSSYGMMEIGTDIPDLEAIVYATFRSSVVQIQGRVERKLKGKRQPIVVDIIDTAYKYTLKKGMGRINWYQKNGLKIIEHNI